MMSAIRDVPERPVPATKIGEGKGMASSQTLSPAPVQAIYPLHPLLRAGPAPAAPSALPDGRLQQATNELSKLPNAPHPSHTDALISARPGAGVIRLS
ncbi:hypothetical protein DKT69_02585 [Micromonospora sicca]|uniref:Uncharacterized protein n=1 Tax=Micromonospora sicca TaxID=2202420 RepID=A0A317DSG0_9ACTN|nr:hypothetical protein DKT69_02585 [Micromonospora sp. 4G51]